jgi:hypothetical protein
MLCPLCERPFNPRAPEDVCPQCRRSPPPAAGAVQIGGLDLGKRADPSALTMIEQTRPDPGAPAHYLIRGLQRWALGTPYRRVVADVKELTDRPPMSGCELVVDSTGCGEPVVEMIQGAGLRAGLRRVYITSGRGAHQAPDGTWMVAKAELVSVVVAVGESGRLQFTKGLALAKIAQRELEQFSAKITAAGNETFGAAADWRERPHDDIVLAIALALWAGERFHIGPLPPPMRDPGNRSVVDSAPPGVFLDDKDRPSFYD